MEIPIVRPPPYTLLPPTVRVTADPTVEVARGQVIEAMSATSVAGVLVVVAMGFMALSIVLRRRSRKR